MSFLSDLKMRQIHEVFQELRKPFQIDATANVVDYNWHVDGILKNSQSYNKEKKPDQQGGTNSGNNPGNVPEPVVI